eukprot:4187195-Ditylum_brightwellii.AAC.2
MQFTFCLKTFCLTPLDDDLKHNETNKADSLLHFDSVDNPMHSTMIQLPHPNNIVEIGSQAS